jgi:hypothetical protein
MATAASPSRKEAHRLSGPGFAAATQWLAEDPTSLALECSLNATNLARWVGDYVAVLEKLKDDLVRSEDDAVRNALVEARAVHERWNRPPDDDGPNPDPVGPARMFLGDLFRPRRPTR